MQNQEFPIWEVFIRSKNGLEHRHVGSLHAADATMAMENARDVYTRREEGVSNNRKIRPFRCVVSSITDP